MGDSQITLAAEAQDESTLALGEGEGDTHLEDAKLSDEEDNKFTEAQTDWELNQGTYEDVANAFRFFLEELQEFEPDNMFTSKAVLASLQKADPICLAYVETAIRNSWYQGFLEWNTGPEMISPGSNDPTTIEQYADSVP